MTLDRLQMIEHERRMREFSKADWAKERDDIERPEKICPWCDAEFRGPHNQRVCHLCGKQGRTAIECTNNCGRLLHRRDIRGRRPGSELARKCTPCRRLAHALRDDDKALAQMSKSDG